LLDAVVPVFCCDGEVVVAVAVAVTEVHELRYAMSEVIKLYVETDAPDRTKFG
jgi:hypothetical protein